MLHDAAALASSDEDVPLPSQRAAREYIDPRLERVASYTTTTMRLKPDKWAKMMATDEFRRIVLEWLEQSQARVLVMTLSPGGELIPKSSMSDLYHNYAVQSSVLPRSSSAPSGEEGGEAMAAATAAAAAAVAATSALLVPLPPPSSSFTTLDGVPRGKCAYFVRRELQEPLTADNFEAAVLFGDFPVHSKIETLSLLFEEVLQPLLENPLNRGQWPALVTKDLQARIKEVRNTLTEIRGKTNNRTILSLLVSPTIVEEVAEHVDNGNLMPAMEPKFRNLLEEMFINWTTQMHDIVMERSDCQPLSLAGFTSAAASAAASAAVATALPAPAAFTAKHLQTVTLPAQEIAFWTNRKLNLQNIYEQLRAPTHKSLALILERIQSAYHPPYAKAFRQLVAAWLEAQDVSLWLQPLLRHTAAFNSVQFSNAQELVAPLVHIVHLVWSNARFYRSTQRMGVLLRCICNMLVHRAAEDLEFPLLFQGDADEGLQKINKTSEVLEFFKQRMLEYKERYSSNQVVLPALPHLAAAAAAAPSAPAAHDDLQQLWRFSAEDVFGQTLDGFLGQLAELRQVFEAAVQFQNLEKLEIGGLRGKLLTERVREIFHEFKLHFEQWTNIDIDLTAPTAPAATQPSPGAQQQQQQHKWKCFKREQAIFFARMQLLEQKLATVLLQAYEQCHNWTQLLKLTQMFGSILQRSAVQPELARILPHLLQIYEAELQQLEQSVAEVLLAYEFHGLAALPAPWNFPPIAGAMMWLQQHMHCCDELGAPELSSYMDKLLLEQTEQQALPSKWAALCTRRNILTTKLSTLQLKIWQHWQQRIDQLIAQGLDECVLLQSPDKQQLHINFSPALFTLLQETKYLLALQGIGSLCSALFALPAPLLRLYAERDAYWQRRIQLIKIGEYYNGIRAGECAGAEQQLIGGELAAIDTRLAAACKLLSWRSFDEPLIADIHDMSQHLYGRLQQSHDNLEAIMSSIRRWSREPLHQRSLYGRNMLDLRHQQERVRLRLLQCDETKMLLNRLLIANFCLFFNYETQQFQIYSRDLSVQEFLHEFPDDQRRQYNKYLASVDELICREVRLAMKIRFSNNNNNNSNSLARWHV